MTKGTSASSLTTISDDTRKVVLGATGDDVTLQMILWGTSTIGTQNGSQKQSLGDACTWVVKSECGAPVIKVASDSTTITSEVTI